MSQTPCNFVWYELITTDAAAAEKFYGAVLGWAGRDAGVPDVKYTILHDGEKDVAGLMALPEDTCAAGAQPGWGGYIDVDDTNAYAARIEEKGGKVLRPPSDIPGVGRFAVVADLHGAVFMIIAPLCDAPQEPQPDSCTPGQAGWRELHAGDGVEAFEFYSELFGWTKGDAMDMGELGVYQLFKTDGDEAVGAIMTKMADTPAPFWNFYFNVAEINAAVTRVNENGGQIVMGPHEVPGGGWIVQGIDPQGAMFALLAMPPK